MLKRLNAAATVGATVLRKGVVLGQLFANGVVSGRIFAWAVSNILVALFGYSLGSERAVACVCYACG